MVLKLNNFLIIAGMCFWGITFLFAKPVHAGDLTIINDRDNYGIPTGYFSAKRHNFHNFDYGTWEQSGANNYTLPMGKDNDLSMGLVSYLAEIDNDGMNKLKLNLNDIEFEGESQPSDYDVSDTIKFRTSSQIPEPDKYDPIDYGEAWQSYTEDPKTLGTNTTDTKQDMGPYEIEFDIEVENRVKDAASITISYGGTIVSGGVGILNPLIGVLIGLGANALEQILDYNISDHKTKLVGTKYTKEFKDVLPDGKIRLKKAGIKGTLMGKKLEYYPDEDSNAIADGPLETKAQEYWKNFSYAIVTERREP